MCSLKLSTDKVIRGTILGRELLIQIDTTDKMFRIGVRHKESIGNDCVRLPRPEDSIDQDGAWFQIAIAAPTAIRIKVSLFVFYRQMGLDAILSIDFVGAKAVNTIVLIAPAGERKDEIFDILEVTKSAMVILRSRIARRVLHEVLDTKRR